MEALKSPVGGSNRSCHHYSHLPEGRYLRLLQFEPPSGGSKGHTPQQRLAVRLSTFPLEEAPAFWALSYTWGAPRYSADLQEPDVVLKTILCDGKPVEIGENVYDFLCEARRRCLFLSDQDRLDGSASEESPKSHGGGWRSGYHKIRSTFRRFKGKHDTEDNVKDEADEVEHSDEPFEYLATLPKIRDKDTPAVPTGRTAYLWADSLCINQADVSERSHQVNLMGAIYKSAESVLVWLGPEEPSENVRWVMEDFVPPLLRLEEHEPKGFFEAKHIDLSDPYFAKNLGEENCKKWRRTFVQFWDYFQGNRWFGRGWIVQEVLLVRWHNIAILAGSKTISFRHLMYFFIMVFLSFKATITVNQWMTGGNAATERWIATGGSTHLRMINSINHLLSKYRRQFKAGPDDEKWDSILRLLCKMAIYGFCDDRDHVYGCLGLIEIMLRRPPRDDELMGPNYALTAAQVFTRTISTYYRNAKDLDLVFASLASHDLDQRNYDELPSWVPDFTKRNRENSFHASRRSTAESYIRFDAVGVDLSEGFLCEIVSTTLYVEGGRLGLVSESVRSRGLRRRKLASHNLWMLDYISQEGSYRGTGESFQDAFLRTRSADIHRSPELVDKTPLPTEGDALEWLTLDIARALRPRKSARLSEDDQIHLEERLNALQPNDQIPTYEAVKKCWDMSRMEFYKVLGRNPWEKYTDRVQSGRELLTTENGYLGLGPKETKGGDEIWIIRGSRIPVVLRKATGKEGYYILGHVYIHGVMHGEAMTQEFKQTFQRIGLV